MATKLQRQQPQVEIEQDERESLDDRIREQVMSALGRPADLRSVQVLKVWGNHYRVNVLVGANAGSVRVANSYFLEVDGDGALVASSPVITKQY